MSNIQKKSWLIKSPQFLKIHEPNQVAYYMLAYLQMKAGDVRRILLKKIYDSVVFLHFIKVLDNSTA